MVCLGQLSYAARNSYELDSATAALIALGIAVVHGSDAAVEGQVYAALDAGATRAQIMAAVGVAVMMGGAGAAYTGELVVSILDSADAAEDAGAVGDPEADVLEDGLEVWCDRPAVGETAV